MTGHYLKDIFLFTITLSLTGEKSSCPGSPIESYGGGPS